VRCMLGGGGGETHEREHGEAALHYLYKGEMTVRAQDCKHDILKDSCERLTMFLHSLGLQKSLCCSCGQWHHNCCGPTILFSKAKSMPFI
jgi:hypothetical protein